MMLWFFEYLFNPQGERRKSSEWKLKFREQLGSLFVTAGGGHQHGAACSTDLESYNIGHMDAIHCSHSSLKQSICLNDSTRMPGMQS